MCRIKHDGGPQEAHLTWLKTEGEAHFQFWLDDQLVVARVSHAALEERFGPRSSPEEYLALVRENFQHTVTDSVGQLAVRGRFEPDGSVLLKPGEWMY